MCCISFHKFVNSSQYESQGYLVKSCNTDNFPSNYVSTGGGFVTRERSVYCNLKEATYLEIETRQSKITSFVGNPNGRYRSSIKLELDDDLRKFLANLAKPNDTDITDISYLDIMQYINQSGVDSVPDIILGCMKAYALYEMQSYGDCDFTRKFGYGEIAQLNVEPIYTD